MRSEALNSARLWKLLSLILLWPLFVGVPGLAAENETQTEVADEAEKVAEQIPPLVVERAAYPKDQAEADAYAKKLMALIKVRAAAAGVVDLKDVTVFIHHHGARVPDHVRWMAETVHASGIPTRVERWNKKWKQMARLKRARLLAQRESSEVLLELAHATQQHPELKSWLDAPLVESILEAAERQARQFFGLPEGFWVTVVPYVNQVTGIRRPVQEQLWDLILSTKLSVLTGIAAYTQILQRFPNTPATGVLAAVATACVWRLIFGYTNRANNVLHTLGQAYRRDIGAFVPKVRWSLMTMFLHSFVASMTFQYALHGTPGLTQDLFWATVSTSLVGLFAKLLPTRLLGEGEKWVKSHEDEKTRNRWKWILILANSGMQFGLEFLKFGTLMGGPSVTTVYWTLGFIGIAELMWQHFFARRKGNSLGGFVRAFRKRVRKDLAYSLASLRDNSITRSVASWFGYRTDEVDEDDWTQFRIVLPCQTSLSLAANLPADGAP